MSADRRKIRGEQRLLDLVSEQFLTHVKQTVLPAGELAAIVERIAAREVDPYSAAADVLARSLEPR